MQNWTDSIVGERMTVDREFNQRIRDSAFTSQEWGLVMTATEFEIENADDPENARIVANTEKVPQIIPELENVRSQMQSMGGAPERSNRGGGGIVDSIKGALGLGSGGGGVDQEKLERAERLTQEYADELQSHLEQKGKWQQVRVAYQE
ncbi:MULTISPECIES: DUF5799 family protein [Haloprofundus]|uniref:DUF5799 family protein n=1 Tax=Haloprofundus TaxID=1911573 RepID=UPI000E448B7F|nr:MULTISPECIES: DUF5799 family protein [Haloprofundus]QCJ48239.1 hypothetical protein FCF25_14395 [Haloprofundus sp. MHR1]